MAERRYLPAEKQALTLEMIQKLKEEAAKIDIQGGTPEEKEALREQFKHKEKVKGLKGTWKQGGAKTWWSGKS